VQLKSTGLLTFVGEEREKPFTRRKIITTAVGGTLAYP
jgi:hypothetical protein